MKHSLFHVPHNYLTDLTLLLECNCKPLTQGDCDKLGRSVEKQRKLRRREDNTRWIEGEDWKTKEKEQCDMGRFFAIHG